MLGPVRIASVISLVVLLPGTVAAEGGGGCLVDGESAELTGKIWRDTFPGPVTGSVFSGHTGHHHTSMLIDVKSIKPATE